MRVTIIGRGNVGCFLYDVLKEGVDCVFLSAERELSQVPFESDVIFYTVRDDVLSDVVRGVQASERTLHLHTSGTLPITIFPPNRLHCGVLYPFQTFTGHCPCATPYPIPLFIESRQAEDRELLRDLALRISSAVYFADGEERQLIHLSGVFANNFSNLMFAVAQHLIDRTRFDRSVLFPLIEQTVHKLRFMSAYEAQTGPAKRNDLSVITKHKQLLQNSPYEKIYTLLTDTLTDIYHRPKGNDHSDGENAPN